MNIPPMNPAHLLSLAQPSPLLADLQHWSLFGEISSIPWIPVIAIGGGLFVVALVGTVSVIFGIRHSQRQHELWHETARVALEKGQPLPPLPEGMKPESKPESRSNDFRSGLILLGVGGGLYVFFVAMNLHFLRFVGAIPGFIGVALLLFGLGSLAFGDKNDPTPRT